MAQLAYGSGFGNRVMDTPGLLPAETVPLLRAPVTEHLGMKLLRKQ